MNRCVACLSFFFAFCLLPFAAVQTASAQSITLGGNDQQIFRMLRAQGYTNPTVTKRGLTIIRTEACKGPDKYQVKVSILGRITSTTKIGTCEVARNARFSTTDANTALEQAGYTQIDAKRQGRRISATACRQNRRYEFTFNRRGEVTNRRDTGACGPVGLSKEQIAKIMQREGYRRVVVTDDKLPRYVAEACRDGDRMRVDLNRRGRIRAERKIGKCGRQLDPANITALLEREGYDRVEVVDRRRPPYVAQACKNADKMEVSIGRFGRILNERRIDRCRVEINSNNLADLLEKNGYDRVNIMRGNRAPYLVEACKANSLYELTINRYGRVRKEDRVGRCSEPMSRDVLQARLEKEGYFNVSVGRKGGGWAAEMCRDEAKIEIRYDAYGDLVGERSIGKCASETVLDVLKTLENRGAQSTNLLVEGCYRGTKYHWVFDRLGNRTGRRAVGSC